MKLHTVLLTLVMGAAMTVNAQNFGPEEYQYKFVYHWGPITKTAAQGTVTMQCNDGNFFATLSGRSIEWGGRYYEVSDTLDANMIVTSPTTLPSERVNHRVGWYRKPTQRALSTGTYNANAPGSFNNTYGQGSLGASGETMEAVDITANMLAMFYNARQVDFSSLSEGESLRQTYINPDDSEGYVDVIYMGESFYNEQPTYRIQFTYSYNGVSSQYPVECEISRETRLPLMFSAELVIGHVEMQLE